MHPPPTYNPAVERELFLLGYRNLRVHVVGHSGLSLLVAAGTKAALRSHRVLGWLSLIALVALYLCAVLSQYAQKNPR